MKKITSTAFAIAMVLAIACKKEDTPQPQTSPTNNTNTSTTTNTTTTTTTGTTGEVITTTDTTSKDSSVLYSEWFTPGTWTPNTTTPGGTSGPSTGNGTVPTPVTPNQSHYFNRPAPAITQAILDKGIVLAYCKLTSDGNNTRPLPANTTIGGVLNIWNYVLSLGNIQFTQFSTSPFALNGIDNMNKFRYVVISGTKPLRLQKPLQEMSYDEVCELFNIPK